MKRKLKWKKTNRSAYVAKWFKGTFLITKEGRKTYSLMHNGKPIAEACPTLKQVMEMASDCLIVMTSKP